MKWNTGGLWTASAGNKMKDDSLFSLISFFDKVLSSSYYVPETILEEYLSIKHNFTLKELNLPGRLWEGVGD